MPKDDHYAIAVGLTNYPGLTDPPADLRGPENDVDSVCAWLLSPAGGDLLPANVKRIVSSDFASPPPDQPWAEHLNRGAFEWIEDIAQANAAAGKGRKVGRRLYIYMSGHGFSTLDRTGCLLTADVAPNRVSANISPSNWMNWWKDAAYFEEFVLILDACMNRMTVAIPNPPPLAWVNAPIAPGPSFAAFAAKRPLKAVEMPIAADRNKFHGVFTWAFLDGVKGAAANAAGSVTGQSMANWLRNALPHRLNKSDRSNPDISLEPEIIAEHPHIVLARGVTPLHFDIELQFQPDAVGNMAQLWSGVPPTASTFEVSAKMTISLPVGLHIVEIPACGYRQGFEVTQAGIVAVTEKGASVAVAANVFTLSIDAGDTANQISIETAEFETADNAQGRINTRLTCGIYRARVRAGRNLVDQVFLLDRDMVLGAGSVPLMASAIPFREAPLSHESQSDLVDHLAERPAPSPGKAEIALVARSWTSDEAIAIENPWDGVRIVDARGREIADLTKAEAKDATSKDGSAHETVEISPKVAFLRFPNNSTGIAEMALPAVAGWRLEAYLLRFRTGEQEASPRVSFIMRNGADAPPEDQVLWSVSENDRFEKCLTALADERPILTGELETLLLRKYKNPLEGIVGAHLLLLQHEADGSADLSDLNVVVRNLRTLVGTEHPDVEALSVRCPDVALRRNKPITAPPLFERSWRIMVDASEDNSELVPLALWKRVAAMLAMPPYLVWSAKHSVKRAYRSTLLKNIAAVATPVTLQASIDGIRFDDVSFVAPERILKPLARTAGPEVAKSLSGGRTGGLLSAIKFGSPEAPSIGTVALPELGMVEYRVQPTQASGASAKEQMRRFATANQLPAAALDALVAQRKT